MHQQSNTSLDSLITFLYKEITSNRDNSLIKDTSKLSKVKYDCYVDSSLVEPLSFSVFGLSAKGEYIIDNPQRLLESNAALLLFVNKENKIIFAVKNTIENKKKILAKEETDKLRIKLD